LLAAILRNAGYVLSGNLGGAALNLLQGVVVARSLGVSNYGLLAATLAVVTTINVLLSSKVAEFTVKFLTEAVEERNPARSAAVLWLSYGVEAASSIVAFVIVTAAAPLLAGWFLGTPANANLLQLYAYALLASFCLETSTGVLRTMKRFDLLSRLIFLQSALLLAASLIAFLFDIGVTGFLLAYIAGSAAHTCFMQATVVQQLRSRQMLGGPRVAVGVLQREWGSMVRFLISTNFGSTLSLVSKNADLLWLSLFRPFNEVGYYKLALSLANLVALPVGSVSQAFYPDIVVLANSSRYQQLHSLVRKGSRITGIWAVLASLGCILAGALFIPLLYGAEFLPSLSALAVLLVGIAVSASLFWVYPTLLALGRADVPNYAIIASILIQIPLIFLLVPWIGYQGSAIVTTVVRSFQVITLWIYLQRVFRRAAIQAPQ